MSEQEAYEYFERNHPAPVEEGPPCVCGHDPDEHRIFFGTQHCMECDPYMRSGGPINAPNTLSDTDSYVGASFLAAEHDYSPLMSEPLP